MTIQINCDAPGCVKHMPDVRLDEVGRLRLAIGWWVQPGVSRLVCACSVPHLTEAMKTEGQGR